MGNDLARLLCHQFSRTLHCSVNACLEHGQARFNCLMMTTMFKNCARASVLNNNTFFILLSIIVLGSAGVVDLECYVQYGTFLERLYFILD